MNPQNLVDIGLSLAQAKAYIALVQRGKATPPELSYVIKESRANTYMILEQLENLGLVKKSETEKKLTYLVESPIGLESLAESKRKQLHDSEMKVKQAMPTLLNYFYSFSEKPGVKMVEGLEGLKSIYQDTLRAKQPIRLVRTPKEVTSLGSDYIDEYKAKRTKLGITTQAITPDVPGVNHDPAVDRANLFTRTWVNPEEYNAPVEINIYGNKVAFSVFGETVMGVVIDSPDVAKAMQQLFDLISTKE
jgi:sugar-specific transcriptional regulator TrmB